MGSGDSRQIIVITGSQTDCLKHAEKITKKLDTLLLKDQKKSHTFLGQEFDAVIFDCHEGFDPNAFGAITGTIRGGGYLLLLKPENSLNDSLFLNRFWSILSKTKHLQIIANSENKVFSAIPSRKNIGSADQDDAIEEIIHVVKGHRRRPLIITADRGRGKSASLGIAAAKLFNEGYKNIIICAPSKKTAAIIFKHALENSPECDLAFYSPDDLQQQKPKADLILIDEAAAIPVSLLTSLLKHYSRIVFASTQHGYEGSGRGFSISFKKSLDKVTPEWTKCELSTPIRWNKNDTLEAFVFDALLLNAKPIDVETIKTSGLSDFEYSQINKTELLKNNSKLSQLFGLLVSAHYQTKPSDLMRMLDDKLISIHVLETQGQIISVALLAKEGNIDPKTAIDIFEGTRRLQGHLVAQSLAANAGISNAPCLKGERIIRVAIHPELQQQGYGSELLNQIIKKSNTDYISTSFGASIGLLYFWQKLAFTPVYLGMKRDASSGTHSIVMLRVKTKAGENLLTQAQERFTKHFPLLLSEPFRNLEADLALALHTPQKLPHNDRDTTELKAFAHKQRGYENTIYPIWKIVRGKLSTASNLNKDEKRILIYKILQKKSWQEIVEKMNDNITGKKDSLLLLRKAVSKLLD